jgi:hypothetical protein
MFELDPCYDEAERTKIVLASYSHLRWLMFRGSSPGTKQEMLVKQKLHLYPIFL